MLEKLLTRHVLANDLSHMIIPKFQMVVVYKENLGHKCQNYV